MAACEQALGEAEEMAQAPGGRWVLPDQVLVGLPASQLRGRAWSISQRRSAPDRPVSEQELETLLERTLRLAVNRLLSADQDGASWVLVDAAPVALTVDGLGVTDPVGFRGREIGATVFAALARAEAIATWGMVAQNLEFSSLTLTATPLALAASLTASQGILLDVGGTTTDLIWCRAGRPVMLNSLPLGGRSLTRLLLRMWNLAPDRAERLKHAYSSGKMDPELGAQVLEVLTPGLQNWLEETEVAMAQLNQEGRLPEYLYMLGGGSALPELTEAVRSLAWSRRLHFARYPQVGHLQPTDVPGVVNRTGLGQGLGDVSALALAAWAAKQQQPADRPALILSELCQG
ncbi:MAG: cell division FtsA domain-containing protein [Anaerolineae bacterium]